MIATKPPAIEVVEMFAGPRVPSETKLDLCLRGVLALLRGEGEAEIAARIEAVIEADEKARTVVRAERMK